MNSHTSSDMRPLAVITGASSGIGYELATEFAKAGFDLIITADNEAIHGAREALQAVGVHVDAVQSDLSTSQGVDAVVKAVAGQGRPLAALALNAGMGLSGDFVQETDLEEAFKLIRLNVMAPVALSKRLIPQMIQRGEGRVLFTSSVASQAPGPYHAVYHASKSFVQSFCEGLRAELKDSGVTVTSLMPGATETQFFARADMLDTKVGQAQKDDPALVAKQGFEAMMKGDDHVVAGSFMNKVQAVISKFLPDTVKANQFGAANKPVLNADDEVDALTMLKRQHQEVEDLFKRIEAAGKGEGFAIFNTLKTKLLDHMNIEEEIFYPALIQAAPDKIQHAEDEHDDAKALIMTITALGENNGDFKAQVKQLGAMIMQHVREEEDELFAIYKEQFNRNELVDLADEMRDLLVSLEKIEAEDLNRSSPPVSHQDSLSH